MASEQQVPKRESEQGEQDEEPSVMKMAHHYESLAQKSKEGSEHNQTDEESKAAHNGAEAKDTIVSAGKTALEVVGEKAVEVKDSAISVGKEAASYAGEKSVVAKDAAVESRWRAAEYLLQKAADASEATANVGRRVAGYAGEKAEEVKEQDAKKSSELKETSRDFKQSLAMKTMPNEDTEDVQRALEESTEKQGGLLGAVGEALIEIAQSTKDLVIGKEPEKKEKTC